eukprot:5663560-Alexandrium_andersonii.AAC.1
MSASLVGSEMCIRDSRASPWRGQSVVVDAAPIAPHLSGASSTLAQRRASVSYTHLTLPTICSV